jgi:hypothetical protein
VRFALAPCALFGLRSQPTSTWPPSSAKVFGVSGILVSAPDLERLPPFEVLTFQSDFAHAKLVGVLLPGELRGGVGREKSHCSGYPSAWAIRSRSLSVSSTMPLIARENRVLSIRTLLANTYCGNRRRFNSQTMFGKFTGPPKRNVLQCERKKKTVIGHGPKL